MILSNFTGLNIYIYTIHIFLEYKPKLRADGKCGLEYLLVEDGSPGECSKYSEVKLLFISSS